MDELSWSAHPTQQRQLIQLPGEGAVMQFEVLPLAARGRETGIYLQAIARRSREIAADIRATDMNV